MSIVNDPIGDLLTRIRNAQAARKSQCTTPLSRLKKELCELLQREGWIKSVEVTGEAPKQSLLLTFASDKSALTVSRISKPGRRIYSQSTDLKPVLRGYGMAILTTSKGLMTDRDAKKQKIGGEVLCTIA